jgi:hypothetical protein
VTREILFGLLIASSLAAAPGQTPPAAAPAEPRQGAAAASPRDAEMRAVYSAVLDLPTRIQLVDFWRRHPPRPLHGLLLVCGEAVASDDWEARFRRELLDWVRFPAGHAAAVEEIVRDQQSQMGRRFRLRAVATRWRHEIVSPQDASVIADVMARRPPRTASAPNVRRAGEAAYIVYPGYVYFNANRTLAVLSYHEFCGDLCSESYWRVLERTANGGWRHLEWGKRSVVS